MNTPATARRIVAASDSGAHLRRTDLDFGALCTLPAPAAAGGWRLANGD
jgi:hypothetical protein